MEKPKSKYSKDFHREIQHILGAVVAVGSAILLLAVQGSIKPDDAYTVMGLTCTAVSVPLSIVCYALTHSVVEADSVNALVDRLLDFSSNVAMVMGGTGVVSIVLGANEFLGRVLVGSTVLSFLVLIVVLVSLSEYNRRLESQESSETEQERDSSSQDT